MTAIRTPSPLRRARVKAVLPSEVNLTGQILPEDQAEKFSFDSKSREIVWNIGDLEPITGDGKSEISFQVGFTPGIQQKGQTPDIVKEISVSGEDDWTEELVKGTDTAINTTLPDDESVSEQQGVVK